MTENVKECLILHFMENAGKHSKILFLFLNLDIFLRNSTPEGFAYICQNKW